jgi:hypothetical protein
MFFLIYVRFKPVDPFDKDCHFSPLNGTRPVSTSKKKPGHVAPAVSLDLTRVAAPGKSRWNRMALSAMSTVSVGDPGYLAAPNSGMTLFLVARKFRDDGLTGRRPSENRGHLHDAPIPARAVRPRGLSGARRQPSLASRCLSLLSPLRP